MKTIRATEARANFAALVRKAAHGKERIVIERRGRPRAALVPLEDLAVIEGRDERAFRESEQRFKDFADASSDWFWEMDEACRISYLSDRFTEMTGVPSESLLGKTREETGVPDVDPEEWRRHLADLAAHRSFRDFRHPRVHPDGRTVHLSINGKAIFDAAGTFCGYRGTGSDVTKEKVAAEALRQAQRMEAVGQLTGGVAHDFNNLFAVIMGNAELLRERLGADEDSVRAIIRAASRGADLTHRLLAFSRRQPLRPQATDLGELLDGMGELLRRTLGETIEVEIAPATDASLVHIDPGQLENAVLNLAINARDAMPKGGHLKIACAQATKSDDFLSTRPEVDPKGYVVLEISDTGAGMERDVLARAVEPFFTTKEVGEGTGLGLSMVYGFAKQSGGELAILSETARGTTVKLYLPRSREAVVPGEFAAAPDADRGHGETVLVVEDDDDARELARTTLEGLGYRVLTAEDARAGLAALETAPRIDLLFSDVVLPGGASGPDMAREAKRRFPELKVLFISGFAGSAAHTGTSLPRNADLLTKPFHKGELAQRVRAALDR